MPFPRRGRLLFVLLLFSPCACSSTPWDRISATFGGRVPLTDDGRRPGLNDVTTPPDPGVPAEKTNTESDSRYKDNPFQSVSHAPLSTIPIDVGKASYGDIRRFLQEGQLPPKDAVRVAEMINAFQYDYAPPYAEHPIALHLEGGACPWEPSHRLVRVAMKAKAYSRENMPPRNLVFLVDVSASMDEPKRLPLVKASLRLLVEQLTEKDHFSIVTYAGETSVHLPSTMGNEKAQDVACDRSSQG